MRGGFLGVIGAVKGNIRPDFGLGRDLGSGSVLLAGIGTRFSFVD